MIPPCLARLLDDDDRSHGVAAARRLPPCLAWLLDDDDRSHGVAAARRRPAAVFHRRPPGMSARRQAAEELFHPATCEGHPT